MMVRLQETFTLGDLLGDDAGALQEMPVTGICSDSRNIIPGEVFFALPGTASHGLDYLQDVVRAQAAAVVYEPVAGSTPLIGLPSVAVSDLSARLGQIAGQFYGTRDVAAGLIGVTGTNGKTSVAWLIAQALERMGCGGGYLGTLGAGRPDDLKGQGLTTPDCFTTHEQIAVLANSGVGGIGMEVSSHALDQDRVAGVPFSTAIFTNLSRDHLDYHADMEAYGAAKARLSAWPTLSAAVYNLDDEWGRNLAASSGVRRRYGVSLEDRTAAGAEHVHGSISVSENGIGLSFSGAFGEGRIASRLLGDFNGENLLLAFAALVAEGHEVVAAAQALGQAPAPPGRMERFAAKESAEVVVDFAHTPEALRRALAAIRAIHKGRVIVVFGCGGGRDSGKRPLMGEVAGELADEIIVTSDNPRDESPEQIAEAIVAPIKDHPGLTIELDRAKAIREAIEVRGGAGDWVLIAGKGHETTLRQGSNTYQFSDRAEVQKLLWGGRC